ncbi:MarR family winged helix-turn-helix transcriptional regulator [Chelatococcus composti]|jgi:DNA-binding MarR family transcriptional regulator|uniref:DNA-binding MarR family transcriptional regulator n=1 Tax=Chelatococcus composti TaxID=1743235 RepID=A0A841KBH4_9HYPH|nr:MarR family transcriptional regulator [Chelatococcus composti]MBB6169520.1 DNA-binding MarR family transcriptional regulator [Chelatococcus composti]MBS7736105.1 MarR family transcriptional regulator [Chelatococcus composti]PZN37974.1 MAG: MarR family transcriptional regulator [Pseudomonadota bacterium]GGG48341.1 transcriptional regulator [Chelatococcus composti]
MTAAKDQRPGRLDDFLCFMVYSTGLAFNRVYKPLLDRLGLTYSQFLVIMSLAQQDDQTVGSIGEGLFLESNTLTPLIKRLEAAGFVTRHRDPDDERVVRVCLTQAGRRLAEEAACLPQKILEATGMSPDEVEAGRRSLAAVRERLRAGASERG